MSESRVDREKRLEAQYLAYVEECRERKVVAIHFMNWSVNAKVEETEERLRIEEEGPHQEVKSQALEDFERMVKESNDRSD